MPQNKRSKKNSQSAAVRARRQQKEYEAELKREEKEKRKSLGIKIAAGVFALLMGLSMLLPSLSYFFSNASTEAAQASNVSLAGAASVEDVDSAYEAVVADLEKRLEKGDNAQVLVRLGNDYMSWASAASTFSTTDEEKLHVQNLYTQAGEYFDRYLTLKENPDISARRGLAYYYAGDTKEGIDYLESYTAQVSDHAPSWVYLGMMYEATGDTDAALQAYIQAARSDTDDAYGLRSYINGRVAELSPTGYTQDSGLENDSAEELVESSEDLEIEVDEAD